MANVVGAVAEEGEFVAGHNEESDDESIEGLPEMGSELLGIP